ncbi:MAG: hypothetical protein NZ959_03575 [Armatimonadetes bacterium]|nr:hypothetical protein [Armatimonadota bacterium]MDW8121722.1 hypothetical protein [Armatimonadota bacterium]
MRVGFASRDITPEVGAPIPGGFFRLTSTGVHDPLLTTAAVFEDGERTVALVAVDGLFAPTDLMSLARQEIERRFGISAEAVLIGASHTHSGGPIANGFESTEDRAYRERVALAIADAVGEAREKSRDCWIGVGSGLAEGFAFNRRFIMRDGSHATHPGKGNPNIVAPAGPVDPSLPVLAVKGTDGSFLGAIVGFACHCTTMGGTLFSADYPFYLRQALSRVFGSSFHTLFFAGASGDVTQVDNRSNRPLEFGEEWSFRIGTGLAGEAVNVIAKMEFVTDGSVHYQRQFLRLPLRPVPESMKQEAENLLSQNGPPSVERVYAREILLLAEQFQKSPTVEAEVVALSIGRAAFVSIPGELFCAYGLRIKKGSPFPVTFVVTCANGSVGYLPTPEAFIGGGYEVRLARTSQLMPQASEMIVATAQSLLTSLPRPTINPSPPVRSPAWDVGASPPEKTGLVYRSGSFEPIR